MPESEPKRIGLTVEVKPHAYDPATQPELFEGVLARRVMAFVIDVVIITVTDRILTAKDSPAWMNSDRVLSKPISGERPPST